MSSTIYYKFRSQRDTFRVGFDGTGITVFDLKRDIINDNRLGDGTDFQLKVYNPDTMEEYEDDTAVIGRSSMVIAKRCPSVKLSVNGKSVIGNATRYVMGKPRVMSKRAMVPNTQSATSSRVEGQTEEERIANMFANQETQWEQTQQEMSQAQPVFQQRNTGAAPGQDQEPPPPGYTCYRCGGRGHWIKNCPTNNNPNFEGKRIKRTTGIPKKFLKSIEIDPSSMTPEEMAEKKIMVTDEGKFVVHMADQTSWEDYQRRQQQQSYMISQEDRLYMKGQFTDLPKELTCPLTGGLLRDPVKCTKCCGKVVSRLAMEDALLDSDFVCPLCQAHDALLDSLEPVEELKEKIDEFIKENKKRLLDDEPTTAASSGVEPESKKQKIIAPPPVPFMPFMFPMAPFFGVSSTTQQAPSQNQQESASQSKN
ncbi:unnamed protein product [Kluyveromyces dobzhanskii CBS 2104]|uniref:WGS project CCBQ000000000 data, contig 00015 n=1 Tax=Kluyveromyces dobzhanskii CBS 2104 TaxID=1427455 RepID=A0A0A8LBC4_9SACH|nr:unnamed protein product [Kluyveromyces dobzhanskii CBS 2104]